jgi:bifunctional non-homologous end joining protein LigD
VQAVASLPVGEQWAFELELDGYRCIAVKHGNEIMLFSRHQKVLIRRFSGVVETFGSLKGDFVLDGELVALDPQGRPSFRLLQGATTTSIPIYFYAFDVLNENAQLLLDQPLSQRRAVLESLLAGAPEALRVSPLLRAAIGTDPRGAA